MSNAQGDPFVALEIRAPRGARIMEIVFDDGHEGVYPHEILRGYCPCAQCQGHSGPIRFLPGPHAPAALELSDLGEVGNYALRLTWGDGHSTGLYSFQFLRKLCACAACVQGDPTARSFSR